MEESISMKGLCNIYHGCPPARRLSHVSVDKPCFDYLIVDFAHYEIFRVEVGESGIQYCIKL